MRSWTTVRQGFTSGQRGYCLKSLIEVGPEEHRESQISYMWNEYEITSNNALQYKRRAERSESHEERNCPVGRDESVSLVTLM